MKDNHLGRPGASSISHESVHSMLSISQCVCGCAQEFILKQRLNWENLSQGRRSGDSVDDVVNNLFRTIVTMTANAHNTFAGMKVYLKVYLSFMTI